VKLSAASPAAPCNSSQVTLVSSAESVTTRVLSTLTVIDAGSRPTDAQCRRNTSTLCRIVAASPVMLQ
jgi:hypothetical protein